LPIWKWQDAKQLVPAFPSGYDRDRPRSCRSQPIGLG